MRLEGKGQLKNPMTSAGIEPTTFFLVAQCLNQLLYRVHRVVTGCFNYSITEIDWKLWITDF
jgi:hypothetical protein